LLINKRKLPLFKKRKRHGIMKKIGNEGLERERERDRYKEGEQEREINQEK
jgi:hypothetical protein